MKTILLSMLLAVSTVATAAQRKPNILVILSDDQGYLDTGFQGSKDIPTPQLDRLAASGLRCTSGYASHTYCSPSRAALLTGRYQMRFGHERNPQPQQTAEGLPVTETLLPELLKKGGYATGWIGKWHLGAESRFYPENRGFDDTFGFLGGGHNYLQWKPEAKKEYNWPIRRNGKDVDVAEHLTLAFGHEAASFIARHKEQPWFLYLAFNAPHSPNQPTAERLARFSHIQNKQRRAFVAQVSLMDDAIGEALDALRDSGQDRNTLVFFLSDNGGATFTGADNGPLHGNKGMVYEGGVRVPFVVARPGTLPSGKDYEQPVSMLDIFATALACAGLPMPTDKPHDGVDLLPCLTGKQTAPPHDALFWRCTEPGKRSWAVRSGNDKLVWIAREPQIFEDKFSCYRRDDGPKETWLKHTPEELYDLSNDLGERKDLSAAQRDATRRLLRQLQAWDQQGAPLAFPGGAGSDKGPRPALPES